MRGKWLSLAVLAGLALTLMGPGAAAARSCNRACLEKTVDRYLFALAAHDPSRLPAAQGMSFVENDQPLALGQGTWVTVDGLGSYRHVFSDPDTGAVAAIATVREHGVPAILDLVLKMQGRKIASAESMIIRDAAGAARYDKLGAPPPEWLTPVPSAQRISRQALIATSDKYLQGMQRNDPKGDYSFFDPDCQRLEHAEQTTNLKTPQAYGHSNDKAFSSLTCEEQFKTGFLGFVTEIRDRRYLVVDEERQAVFVFADLDHNGTVRTLPSVNGTSSPIPDYFDVPRTLQAGEAYRMRGDKLWRIEMTLTELPYGMRPASEAKSAPVGPGRAASACDRDCLEGVLEQLLDAIAAHDPARAPLTPDARYTENGQLLKVGEGLWLTMSAIAIPGDGLSALGPESSAYRLTFADSASGEIGYLGATNENGTPGMLMLRVKVAGGKIAQIEATAVRREDTGPRGGAMTLFRPRLFSEFQAKGFTEPPASLIQPPPWPQRTSRAFMAWAVDRYFDGLEKHSSADVPFAPDCMRRENGGQVTGNSAVAPPDSAVPAFKPFALGCAAQFDSGFFGYVSKVRDRRDLVIDEERGLVMALALVDHAGTVTTLSTPAGPVRTASNLLTPSTDLTVAVFQFKAGKIERVEALVRPVPYGMTSGWEP